MQAIVYNKYGSKENLNLQELPLPKPKEEEVLIEIKACAVNSWDWDLLRGKPYLVRMEGWTKPKHKILGADVAGIVVAVGSKTNRLQVGDAVYGDMSSSGWGGFASHSCAKESCFAPMPTNLSYEEAASIPQAATLAYQGLTLNGPIQKGAQILINGAGGGVGAYGIQLAKMWGAEVTAVDHTNKLDFLKKMGADRVLDYTQCTYTALGDRYDLILDNVAQHPINTYKKSLKDNGIFIMVGGNFWLILPLLLSSIIPRNKKTVILPWKQKLEDLEFLTPLFQNQTLFTAVDKIFDLSETGAAIEYVGLGHCSGKAVVRC